MMCSSDTLCNSLGSHNGSWVLGVESRLWCQQLVNLEIVFLPRVDRAVFRMYLILFSLLLLSLSLSF